MDTPRRHRRQSVSPRARAGYPAPPAESRVVMLADGTRVLVTVVARLRLEDAAASPEGARLVVRLEWLTPACTRRQARIVTVRAASLLAVDDDALRQLAGDDTAASVRSERSSHRR